jgi:hypothetical protein
MRVGKRPVETIKRRHLLPARCFPHTAFEVAEILAQMVECKTQREDAFRRIDGEN